MFIEGKSWGGGLFQQEAMCKKFSVFFNFMLQSHSTLDVLKQIKNKAFQQSLKDCVAPKDTLDAFTLINAEENLSDIISSHQTCGLKLNEEQKSQIHMMAIFSNKNYGDKMFDKKYFHLDYASSESFYFTAAIISWFGIELNDYMVDNYLKSINTVCNHRLDGTDALRVLIGTLSVHFEKIENFKPNQKAAKKVFDVLKQTAEYQREYLSRRVEQTHTSARIMKI